ncbi:MAG: PEPxxWA-CTERM sorting domain-containing protein [Phenylobacterium sp.]|uniref:PEPxxWA-CTERM sorting domain-containing protein n=1 Tax=Phenylobacterium sp. TaxID=1871053 RepID=UPI001A49A30E|nr:PEPxxWA-CTERM sorting domain-containing protein [Phenylobacterium sp.]MBL8553104.1 PEPxxWA-CTERM sorting domain-containing protein [Phenylobacterium sp.]
MTFSARGVAAWTFGALCATTLVATPAAADAVLIDFEEVGVENSVFPYYTQQGFQTQGYDFSDNSDVVDVDYYVHGTGHSGQFAVLNDYTGPIDLIKVGGGTFTLTSFWFRNWGVNDTFEGSVTGYLGNDVVGSANLSFSNNWTFAAANFASVDRVTFSGNSFMLFDDISIDGGVSTAVPEPGAWALMILGFGAAGAALRRRRLVAA